VNYLYLSALCCIILLVVPQSLWASGVWLHNCIRDWNVCEILDASKWQTPSVTNFVHP
jgi:hypothetical protein